MFLFADDKSRFTLILLREHVSQFILRQEVRLEESDRIVYLSSLPQQLADFPKVKVKPCVNTNGAFALLDTIKVELKQVPVKIDIVWCHCQDFSAFHDWYESLK